MGQQQLLLIVLGVVIVGIAILAGITAYSQNNVKSDLDGVTHDCMRLASDAQAYAQKPVQFGGGYNSATDPNGYSFAPLLSLANVGWNTPTQYSDIIISTVGTDALIGFQCTSIRFPANNVVVDITGILDSDIATSVTKGQ